MIREDAGGGRVKIVRPKKKKKTLYGDPRLGPQKVVNKPYKKPKVEVNPKIRLPHVPDSDFNRPDPIPENVKNLTQAWTAKFGSRPTAQQSFEMISTLPVGQIMSQKDWSHLLAPALAAEPFTAKLMRVSRLYMDETGAFPSPEKARGILESANPDNAVLTAANAPGADDISMHQHILREAAREQAARLKRPGAKWSKKDLIRLGRIMGVEETESEADKTRKLANTTIHGNEMSYEQQKKIWDARGWYMPTSVKQRILARQNDVTDDDGSFNEDTIKMFSMYTGQNNGNMKDPDSFAHLVNTLGGKPRSQLNKKERRQLDSVASFLSEVYPKEFQIKKGEKPIFDENMYTFAARYLMESSLPMLLSNRKVNGKPVVTPEQKAIAMINMSVATGGKIKPDTNIYQWLTEMRMLGDADQMWSEKLGGYLFDAYRRTTGRNHSFEMQVAGFANLMGEETLPKNYAGVNTRDVLKEVRGQFANVYMAIDAQKQQKRTGVPNILTALSEGVLADIKVMNEYRSGKTFVDPSKAKQFVLDPDSLWERASAVPKTEYRRKGKALQVVNPDPFDPVGRWVDEEFVPTVGGVALGFMDSYERLKNQIWLTLLMMSKGSAHGHINFFEQMYDFADGKKKGGVAAMATAIDVPVPLSVDAWSWHSIRNSWSAAGKEVNKNGELLSDPYDLGGSNIFEKMQYTFANDPAKFTFGNRAYMEAKFDEWGLDPKEHSTLMFMADGAWSLAADFAVDAGLKVVASLAKMAAAQLATEMLSPALKAEVKAAQAALSVSRNARMADRAALKATTDGMLARANAAEKAGFSELASEIHSKIDFMNSEAAAKLKTQFKETARQSRTISLLTRPMWYDNFAYGLSKAKQEPWMLERILNITTEGMTDTKRIKEVKRITAVIARSTDEDVILKGMNDLRLLGVKLDSGKIWLGKTRNYAKWFEGDDFAAMRHTFPTEERIIGGAEKTTELVESLGTLGNMGFISMRKAEAAKRVQFYMKKIWEVDGATVQEINYKKQQIWREFTDEIVDNMKHEAITPEMVDSLRFWAHRNGFETSYIDNLLAKEGGMNNWDGYQIFRRIKQHKGANKDLGFGKEKGLPVYAVDESGIISNEPEFYPSVREGNKHTTGQLAKDLVAPFNIQDLISYQRGKASREMWMHTGIMWGIGPSWMGMVNASKTLAISNMAFPISAFFIDEFYRFPVEYARGGMKFNPVRYRELRRLMKDTGRLREVGGDFITEILGRSKQYIAIAPTDPMYDKWLNAFNTFFEKNDFFQDFKRFLDDFPKGPNETDEMYRERFYNFLVDRVTEESDEGYELRLHMAQNKRGFDGDVVPGPEVRQKAADYDDTREALEGTFAKHHSNIHGEDGNGGLNQQKKDLLDSTVTRTIPPKSSKTLPFSESQLEVFPDYTLAGKANKNVWNANLRWLNNPTQANFENLKKVIGQDLKDKIDNLTKEVDSIRQTLRDEAQPTVTKVPGSTGAMKTVMDAQDVLDSLRKATAKMPDEGLADAAKQMDDIIGQTKDELKALRKQEADEAKAAAAVAPAPEQTAVTGSPMGKAERTGSYATEKEAKSALKAAEGSTGEPHYIGYANGKYYIARANFSQTLLPEHNFMFGAVRKTDWEKTGTGHYVSKDGRIHMDKVKGATAYEISIYDKNGKLIPLPKRKKGEYWLSDSVRTWQEQLALPPGEGNPLSELVLRELQGKGPYEKLDDVFAAATQPEQGGIVGELIKPKKNPFEGMVPRSAPDGVAQLVDDFMTIPDNAHFDSAKTQLLAYYEDMIAKVDKAISSLEARDIRGEILSQAENLKLKQLAEARAGFENKMADVAKLRFNEKRVGGRARAPKVGPNDEAIADTEKRIAGIKRDIESNKKLGLENINPQEEAKLRRLEEWLETLKKSNTPGSAPPQKPDSVDDLIDQLEGDTGLAKPKPKPSAEAVALEKKIKTMEKKVAQIRQLLDKRAAKQAEEVTAPSMPTATPALDVVNQLPPAEIVVPKPKPNMSPAGVKKLQAQIRKLKKQLTHLDDEKMPVHDVIEYGPTQKEMKLRTLLDIKRPTSKRWIADWLRDRHKRGLESYMGSIFDKAEGARKATDDEIKAAFDRLPKEKYDELAEQMFYDWRAETYEVKGITEYAAQRDAIDKAIEAEKAAMQRAKTKLDEHLSVRRPTVSLDSNSREWLQRSVDRLFQWNGIPELWDAAVNGKTLSKSQIDAIQKRLVDEGRTLPTVIGAANEHAGLWGSGPWLQSGGEYGRIPIISKLAEMGPYNVLSALSKATRNHAYIAHMMVELDELEKLGFKKINGKWSDEAIELAHARSKAYTDEVMYSSGRTPMEQDTRGLFMFMPAYRQALQYWGREIARNPMVYTGIYKRINNDYPMAYYGDYGSILPLPFWAQGSPAEAVVPGLVPPILYPLRVVNTMSGWSKITVEDAGGASHEEWQYTGQTKFDWMSEGKVINLFTGFASKNVSPLSFIDDFMWGFGDDSLFVPTAASNKWLGRLYSFAIALRKDPYARRKAAMNIYAAQVSRGMRPDLSVMDAQIKGSPWWYNIMQDTGIIEHPEGIFKGITGTIMPRKITYDPSDIGEIVYAPGEDRSINNVWDLIRKDGEARKIADAEYLYIMAETDKEKQAVLDKYPQYKKIVEFRQMDAYERAQYLADPKNRGRNTVLPYVGSRNEYTPGGKLLLGDDYYTAMREGMIRKKDMYEFIGTLQKLNVNAQWDQIKLKIDEKKKADDKAAIRLLKKAAKEMATTPAEYQSYLADILRFKNGWVDKPVPSQYKSESIEPMDWMVDYAYTHGLDKKPTKWNLQAINDNYWDTLAEMGADTTELEPEVLAALRAAGANIPKTDNEKAKRPEGANMGGVESMYSNPRVKNWDLEHGVGGMKEISDALTELMSPEDRDLFDLKNSMSAHAIKEELKKNAEYRRYLTLKYAGQEYWKYVGVKQLKSIGVPVADERKMTHLLVHLGHLYEQKKAKTAKYEVSSDEYKAVLKWYKTEYKKALSPDWAQPLREGPARRLMYTHLVKPGSRAKLDMGYVGMALSQMYSMKPNYDFMMGKFRVGKNSNGHADKLASATAWTVVLGTAVNYRNKMANTYNEWGDYSGVTPDSKAGEPYVNHLTRLVNEWKKRSPLFKRSWEELGGDSMISTFLDAGS